MKRDSGRRPGMISGASVEVRNGDVNGALRRLKKILDNANRQKELAKREFFEKDSIKNRRSRQTAVRKAERDRVLNFSNIKDIMPQGVAHMKSKRKRRRVLDNLTAFDRMVKERAKQQAHKYGSE